MIRAEIRYADSSGVESGTTCARLSQARSPACTSHPATSSRVHRRLRAGRAAAAAAEAAAEAAATGARPVRSRGRTTVSQPSALHRGYSADTRSRGTGPGQECRQATQPAAWSEATIFQPAGWLAQLADAGWPGGQPVSTTVTPAGGASDGLKNSSSLQVTSKACGAHR